MPNFDICKIIVISNMASKGQNERVIFVFSSKTYQVVYCGNTRHFKTINAMIDVLEQKWYERDSCPISIFANL